MPILAHYLNIEWQECGVARNIEISSDSIEIEMQPDGTMCAETLIFKDFYPWVGLRLLGELANEQPQLLTLDGTRLPWRCIQDHEGRDWWVFETGWSPAENRHLCEMHRSIGRFDVAVGARRLILTNIALELDRAGAEEYLEAFRDELVWLALGKAGGATGEVLTSHDQDLVEALSEFSTAAGRVLDHPSRAIRETTSLAPSNRVRPSAITFREALTRSGAREYTGRVARESADTPENRYLRHMVEVCAVQAWRIAHSALRHGHDFASASKRQQLRSDELLAARFQTVDPTIYENQLQDLKKRINAISVWRDDPGGDDRRICEYRFRVGKVYNRIPNSFFYRREDGSPAVDPDLGIEYSVVQLPEGLFDIVKAAATFDKELSLAIEGVATVTKHGKMRLARFEKVVRVTAASPMLERREQRREQYRRNGWRRALTKRELEEAREEARVLKLRADRLSIRAALSTRAGEILLDVYEYLRRQDLGWKALHVPASAQFPMGMHYAQNPRYNAALAAFQRVTSLNARAGIGETTFEKLSRINILHASALYERWCLIKIISVLVEHFGFEPHIDWIDRVVSGAVGQIESFAIEFSREVPKMRAILEVQPRLANGRRPDFRLIFHHDDRRPPLIEGGRAGIVMDAKFRTRWHRGELERLLDELVEAKDYGGEGDRVFILQPANSAMGHITSPFSWGKHSDYGQNSPLSHSRGAIMLSSAVVTVDNLKRLIGLELQSGFSPPEWDEQERRVVNVDSLCIHCGAGHKPANIFQRETRSGNPYWVLYCAECETASTRTHCFGCIATLHKNGLHMTYHLTVADQWTNIVCPMCGEFFERDSAD